MTLDLLRTIRFGPLTDIVRRICFLLIGFLAFASFDARAVTIMKAVGHGDCYLIISDGRVVVIDVGPLGETGLVSLLKSGFLHYDRIVITHVHSDHAGGLLTAAQYAARSDSKFSTDALVSNHGSHDLDLILNESRLQSLLTSMRGQKQVVGLDDDALSKLALDDPHLRVEGIPLPRQSASENRSGLIIKVTEIRDETKRAILFLGDIEESEQRSLLTHPDVAQIFSDVQAVTLPHHGRPTTLWQEFFQELKRVAGDDAIVLHSDRLALDPHVRALADQSGIKVISTVPTRNQTGQGDVVVNLFKEQTYLNVTRQATTLSALVQARFRGPASGEATVTERIAAVAAFSGRKAQELLPIGTTISVPTEEWLLEYTASAQNAYRQQTDELIELLQSTEEDVVRKASRDLSLRASKLTKEQARDILRIAEEGGNTWRKDLGHPRECEHKTIYNIRSVGYYAGAILQQPGARVSAADRARALHAQRDGNRRDIESDPGWV
jgi:beta-lactamase superfamily II metal-dependent hydrolase